MMNESARWFALSAGGTTSKMSQVATVATSAPNGGRRSVSVSQASSATMNGIG